MFFNVRGANFLLGRRLAAKTNQRSVDARVDSNYADMINSIINSNLNAVSPK